MILYFIAIAYTLRIKEKINKNILKTLKNFLDLKDPRNLLRTRTCILSEFRHTVTSLLHYFRYFTT
jgi:hypothetical protein